MPDLHLDAATLDPSVNPRKRQLAAWLDGVGLLEGTRRVRGRWLGAHVRCVNYHSVPARHAESFDRQLRWLERRFVPVGPKELLNLQEGHWPHRRPGLLLSFDDGCRTHAEVVAPLLQKHGLVGWFFVPSDLPDVPVEEQPAYVAAHKLTAISEDGSPRRAVTWDQVRELDRHHVVGCHTRSHARLGADVDRETAQEEVLGAKRRLEQELGHPVSAFAWVGGEESAYSATGARVVAEAGFRYAFGTNNWPWRSGDDPLRIERTNLEAYYPPELLRFQISGLLDWMYAPKRRRLSARLAARA